MCNSIRLRNRIQCCLIHYPKFSNNRTSLAIIPESYTYEVLRKGSCATARLGSRYVASFFPTNCALLFCLAQEGFCGRSWLRPSIRSSCATWLPHKWKTNGSRWTEHIKSQKKTTILQVTTVWTVNMKSKLRLCLHIFSDSHSVYYRELAEVLEKEHSVNPRLLLEPGKTILPSASPE